MTPGPQRTHLIARSGLTHGQHGSALDQAGSTGLHSWRQSRQLPFCKLAPAKRSFTLRHVGHGHLRNFLPQRPRLPLSEACRSPHSSDVKSLSFLSRNPSKNSSMLTRKHDGKMACAPPNAFRGGHTTLAHQSGFLCAACRLHRFVSTRPKAQQSLQFTQCKNSRSVLTAIEATGKSRSKIQVLMALPGLPFFGQGLISMNSQSSSIVFRRGSHSNKRSLGTVWRTFSKN